MKDVGYDLMRSSEVQNRKLLKKEVSDLQKSSKKVFFEAFGIAREVDCLFAEMNPKT